MRNSTFKWLLLDYSWCFLDIQCIQWGTTIHIPDNNLIWNFMNYYHGRHKPDEGIEPLSTVLAFVRGNPVVTGGFPSQRASNVKLRCFFFVNLKRLLNKPWDAVMFMWRHCSANVVLNAPMVGIDETKELCWTKAVLIHYIRAIFMQDPAPRTWLSVLYTGGYIKWYKWYKGKVKVLHHWPFWENPLTNSEFPSRRVLMQIGFLCHDIIIKQ